MEVLPPNSILQIPEIIGLDARHGMVRIPPELDVPLTSRVRRIVDTFAFRRLARISQLGLVSLVYPAAHHQRFEHSLGVYRLCLRYLKQLAHDARFVDCVQQSQAERLILASLLHDLGHWPFCHAIEDLQLPSVPSHESFARRFILNGPLSEAIDEDWQTTPLEIADLLHGEHEHQSSRLLASILSGPIDVDKMDYLMRDSLHAGVPYGRNFDQARLIGSLCVNQAGDGLALTDKGRTAAEMMVFARYVMFSEVYWHHAVRAATAMFQRAFYRLYEHLDLEHLFSLTEQPFIDVLRNVAGDTPTGELLDGIFGTQRRLYKRWVEYSCFEEPDVYRGLARQPYPKLVEHSERIAAKVSKRIGRVIDPDYILVDAPPSKLEVQFKVDIQRPRTGDYCALVDVSPVVRTLAEKQFDDYVKRVRVFLHPEIAAQMAELPPSLVH